MGINLNSIMIGTSNAKILGEFYAKVFDQELDSDDSGWYGFQVGNCYLTIGEHSEVKDKSKEPARLMFNLEAEDVKAEFEKIKSAIPDIEVVAEPYEMEGWEGGWVATFADPDGNYFQLMTPWSPED